MRVGILDLALALLVAPLAAETQEPAKAPRIGYPVAALAGLSQIWRLSYGKSRTARTAR